MAALSPVAAASLARPPTSTCQVTALSLWVLGACQPQGWSCDCPHEAEGLLGLGRFHSCPYESGGLL